MLNERGLNLAPVRRQWTHSDGKENSNYDHRALPVRCDRWHGRRLGRELAGRFAPPAATGRRCADWVQLASFGVSAVHVGLTVNAAGGQGAVSKEKPPALAGLNSRVTRFLTFHPSQP